MAVLNEKNATTKKKIHLMVTSLCLRDCKYCRNKQYDLNAVPYATGEELSEAESIFITGGEPFQFTDPGLITQYLRERYRNIKRVIVYTNAIEFFVFLATHPNYDLKLFGIDGVTVSIKNDGDKFAFRHIIENPAVKKLTTNMLYVFDGLFPEDPGNFSVREREWEREFVPEPESIFRRI